MIIIDADVHICEPKDVFTSRMPSKYGDLIPQVKYVPELGADYWFVGDRNVWMVTSSVVYQGADGSYERRQTVEGEDSAWALFPKRFEEQHPSSYDPNERVKVMDDFGILAAATYPNLGLVNPDVYLAGSHNDLKYQAAVVAAYNDWVNSWATEQPGRFIPLANVPYWNIDMAVKEVVRCADMGMMGLVMSGVPESHGCPALTDTAWDPLWAAAQDAQLSISFHAGGGEFDRGEYHTRIMGSQIMQIASTVGAFMGNAVTAIDILLSGVLQRFPKLNFAIVESGVGWVPFVLECLDEHYKRFEPWLQRPEMKSDELPSDLFRRQMFVNTWYERLDLQSETTLPVDNLMFETDYPHPTCLFKHEIEDAIGNLMKSLSPEDKEKVLFRNAMRCFNLSDDFLELGAKTSV
jgi:predicted TIM-barrel fold metal-dependent hydrolase